ncbi:MAG TPA: DUF2958 domain-containing protein [Flavobacteriales bacterium]|nr:DUF2958 domain-containing protein [Flavobacteriales bacterium]
MKLITREIIEKAPALGSQDDKSSTEVMIVAKFFNPCGAGTWYMTEYDSEKKMGFGWVSLGFGPECDELGYFSIDELESIEGPLKIGIERDIHWQPRPLSEVMSANLV